VPIVNFEYEQVSELDLPKIFETPIRPDIIKKAVIHHQSHSFQPQGRDPMAGKRTTAESKGVGLGISRVPRIKTGMRAAFGVSIVGGHQAFPPKSEKRTHLKINKKEKRLAIRSGIAATAIRKLVEGRGHRIESTTKLPIVVEDDIEALKKTREVKELFQKLGIWADVKRADRKKIRAGRGKTRGRKRKIGKSPLIVVSKERSIFRAARNIPGVDISTINGLNAELLAPGAHIGRLVVWSKSAFKALDEIWLG
jgi:large subunit ribosomal protein L4e